MHPKSIQGRVLEIGEGFLIIRNEHQTTKTQLNSNHSVSVGDIVSIRDGNANVLTVNRSPTQSARWMNHVLDPRRRKGIQVRSQVEASIRDFFLSQGFHETQTPLLVPCPGMETHIRPFKIQSEEGLPLFLPTSPEFAMKRLLVGGLEKIFQITSSFRNEPQSPIHRPEFSMLEWYRAYAGFEEIMVDTELMFEKIALKLFGKPELVFQAQTISVKAPWPRLRVRDLFKNLAGVDLVSNTTSETLAIECQRLGIPTNLQDTWDDLYFKIWLNQIEPRLPADQAVFVTHYPASQAALAVIETHPDGSRWARRFELYAGGIELGNAFEELTDPIEQRKRFIHDMQLRTEIYGDTFPQNPLDEDFLEALTEGMPPSGGIAVGVDRMVMLFGDEPEIGFTRYLT